MTTGNEVTHHKQQVNARLSAQARAVLAAIHERTGSNNTAIIEFALAFLLAGLDGGWATMDGKTNRYIDRATGEAFEEPPDTQP